MAEFIVYRTGDGADRRAIARVEAATAEEACRIAGRDASAGPNETLTAEPAAVVDAQEAERNRTSRDLARDTRGGEGTVGEV